MKRYKKLYIVSMILITVVLTSVYFSYAFFANKNEQHGKLNVVVGDISYLFESSDLNDNKIVIPNHSFKNIKLSIKNLKEFDIKYKLFYKILTTLTENEKSNISIGYSYLSENINNKIIGGNQEKELIITFINKTDKNIEFEMGVNFGFKNNEIELALGEYEIENEKLLIDYSGNEYHGKFINGTKVVYDNQVNMYGIDFDGIDDYVDVGNLPETIDWANGFTIEFTTKWDTVKYWPRILDFGNGTYNNNILISNLDTTPQFRFYVYSNGRATQFAMTEEMDLTVLNKFKVECKKLDNGNTLVNSYVNGELVVSEEILKEYSPLNVLRTTNYLGKSNWPGDEYLDGKIYNLKISEADGDLILWYAPNLMFDFDYTGSEQEFTAPINGIYKLETWGAQGGNISTYIGGYGGYSGGSISLSASDKLYLNVGGQGTNTDTGGYNGGGKLRNGQHTFGSSGGGATHIATKSGLLSTLASYRNDILIVSGAGGGANYRSGGYGEGNGGSAGGYIGSNGSSINHTNGYGYGYGTGGSQISGGTLIWNTGTTSIDDSWYTIGGFGTANGNSGLPQSGGGGGHYGGGGSSHGGAGGGSGYIGNISLTNKAMYCYNCTESNEISTKTVSTTCHSSNPTANCAKDGNGYARITLVSLN